MPEAPTAVCEPRLACGMRNLPLAEEGATAGAAAAAEQLTRRSNHGVPMEEAHPAVGFMHAPIVGEGLGDDAAVRGRVARVRRPDVGRALERAFECLAAQMGGDDLHAGACAHEFVPTVEELDEAAATRHVVGEVVTGGSERGGGGSEWVQERARANTHLARASKKRKSALLPIDQKPNARRSGSLASRRIIRVRRIPSGCAAARKRVKKRRAMVRRLLRPARPRWALIWTPIAE